MLRVLLHGLVASLLCLAAPLAVAQGVAGDAPGAYVAGIPDLQLMPGLKELPHGGLVFDKPGGRIVEARSEEHTSELQSLMRTSSAVFSWQKNQVQTSTHNPAEPRHTSTFSNALH